MISILPIQLFSIVICLLGVIAGSLLFNNSLKEFLKSVYTNQEDESSKSLIFTLLGFFITMIFIGFIFVITVNIL